MSARTVLYVVDGLGLSGKTKALADLVLGLDPTRYRAEVAFFDREKSTLLDRLEKARVPLHHVPCQDGLNATVLLRLGSLIRRLRPAVVHALNQRAILYAGGVARALGVPVRVGSLSAFGALVPDTSYTFLPQQLFTRSARNRVRNRLLPLLVQRLVVVSERLGQRFASYSGIPSDVMETISYGVPMDKLAAVSAEEIGTFRASLGLKAGDVLIGSIGRLVEQKDYPTQLSAFAGAEAPAGGALHMVLAGDGPLRGELEALARQLGIEGRVHFLGHREDVPVILRALDVYVLASKFEPFGVAVLEAKAANVAIVATNVNELPELLSDGQSALLVSPGQPRAMAAAFTRLAHDPSLRMNLAQAACQDARKRHDLSAVLGRYQDLYDRLMTSH